MNVLALLSLWVRGCLIPRAALALENVALRQQLAIYRRTAKRPKLRDRDRQFWLILSRLWSGWRSSLVIVQPDTVCRWHRAGFRLFWRWKSRSGRSQKEREVRALIRRLAQENPLWGVLRIRAELKLLGYRVAAATITKYLSQPASGPQRPSSPSWRTFWRNHLADFTAIDFFVVPTATFRLLYCFLVLAPDRRRILHFNVAANPSSHWTSQQIVKTFPFDGAPKYLVCQRARKIDPLGDIRN